MKKALATPLVKATNYINNKIIFFIIALSMFMESMDSTIINVSIPTIAEQLEVAPLDLKTALISYLLSLAVFIPISGWVAEKYGAKKVFILAIIEFTISSIACGFSGNLQTLIVNRIFQGLGGAFMLPTGRLIILKITPKNEIVSKTNLVVMIGVLGMMLGPLIGGYITHYLHWSWIFWVNIPFGIVCYFLGKQFLPTLPPKKIHSLDKIGFILFGAGLSCLMFGVSILSDFNHPIFHSLYFIGLAIGILFTYYFHSKKHKNPIIPFKLFTIPTFKISVLGNLTCRFSLGGIPFLLPLLLQIFLGHTGKTAGFLITAMAFGIFFIRPYSLFFLRKWGYKKILIINAVLISLSIASFGLIDVSTPNYIIFFLNLIYGSFMSLQYTSLSTLAYANIEKSNQSDATSINSAILQLGQSFGVGISAIFLILYSSDGQLSIHSFQYTFLMLSFLNLTSIFFFKKLLPDDGQTLLKKELVNVHSLSIHDNDSKNK